ncbi:MAG TPA: hypothetical protein VFZ21_07815 [Gemmatimonadaceae bacterium]|nr:hypothetical protein [Gemmatimonadaceae bacterium]
MRRILSVMIAFTLAACGHDTTGPSATPSRIPGSYNLTMVDGQALPLTVFEYGAYRATLVSGTLTLHADGLYSLDLDTRIDDSGNVRHQTDSDAGLWNAKDDALTLASTQRAITRAGLLSNDGITLQSSSRVLVLRKK